MAKKMQIKLLPNGEIIMETHGVKGKKCLDYIEIFKKLVDVKIDDVKYSEAMSENFSSALSF